MRALALVWQIVRLQVRQTIAVALGLCLTAIAVLSLRAPSYQAHAILSLRDSTTQGTQGDHSTNSVRATVDPSELAALKQHAVAKDHPWWKQFAELSPNASEDDVVNELLESITLSYSHAEQQLTILATDRSAAKSASIANAFAERGVAFLNQQNQSRVQTNISFLEAQRNEALQQIRKAERHLQTLAASQVAWSASQATQRQLEALNGRLADTVTRRLEVETILANRSASRFEVLSDHGLDTLDAQRVEAEQDIETLSAQLGPKHPQILELGRELERIQSLMDARADRTRNSVEAQAAALTAQETALRSELAALQSLVQHQRADATEFETAKAQLDSLRQASQWWSTQLAHAATNTAQVVPFASIQQQATVPSKPANAFSWLALVLIGLCTVVCSLAWQIIRSAKRQRFVSVAHLECALDARTLAQIPHVDCSTPLGATLGLPLPTILALPERAQTAAQVNSDSRSDSRSERSPQPRSSHKKSQVVYLLPEMELASPEPSIPLRNQALENAFRTLRNELLQSAEGSRQVIAVTSTSEGEGKTTVACNLAHSLAKAGYTTLLIDLDVLQPTRSLRIRGIADYLHQSAEVADIVYQCALPSLYTISAGNIGPDSKDLLYSKAMTELVHSLRLRFEYIVLDAPGVEAAAESMFFAEIADTTLYVVDTERVATQNVTRAFGRLRGVGQHIAGLVVNHRSFHTAGLP